MPSKSGSKQSKAGKKGSAESSPSAMSGTVSDSIKNIKSQVSGSSYCCKWFLLLTLTCMLAYVTYYSYKKRCIPKSIANLRTCRVKCRRPRSCSRRRRHRSASERSWQEVDPDAKEYN